MIKPYSIITTVDLWTEPHIAKNMLETHLNPETDAASRKPETIRKTVDFIASFLPKTAKICDYGCGPGLYSDLLQKNGYEVIGVDISENSLTYASRQNKNVQYYLMNYVTDKIEEKIDFAMMIYCDLGALDPDSMKEALANIHSSLNEGGLFFFDVLSYNWFEKVEVGITSYDEDDGFFMPGRSAVTSIVTKYNDIKLILTYHHVEGEKVADYFIWDKCFTVSEMQHVLGQNGFEIMEVYGNTYGARDIGESETLTFLCKKS